MTTDDDFDNRPEAGRDRMTTQDEEGYTLTEDAGVDQDGKHDMLLKGTVVYLAAPLSGPLPVEGRLAACLTCGSGIPDPTAGTCYECGAEDRWIGSQWLSPSFPREAMPFDLDALSGPLPVEGTGLRDDVAEALLDEIKRQRATVEGLAPLYAAGWEDAVRFLRIRALDRLRAALATTQPETLDVERLPDESRPLPLSAKAIEGIRDWAETHDWSTCENPDHADIIGLLHTLNAERAGRLREAAGALVDEWDAAMAGDMPLNGHYQKQALDRLRAALATTQPETLPTADAEKPMR